MTDDGGYAFPNAADDKAGWHAESGMTLRDYIAVAAMQGSLVNAQADSGTEDILAQMVSSVAYKIADAMLRERSK